MRSRWFDTKEFSNAQGRRNVLKIISARKLCADLIAIFTTEHKEWIAADHCTMIVVAGRWVEQWLLEPFRHVRQDLILRIDKHRAVGLDQVLIQFRLCANDVF